MEYRAHVRIDAAMGPIGATAHFGCSLHHNMVDDQMVHIKAFHFRIALRIPRKLQFFTIKCIKFTSKVEAGIRLTSLANVLVWFLKIF